MPEFVTVREAARLVGKSPSSIRRLIYPIIEADDHPDRVHIRPTVEEVPQLRLKGENFAWRVSEEFLRREIPEPKADPAAAPHAAPAGGGDSGLIETLRRELEIKNAQIAQQSELLAHQMQLISGLSERLREGNVLIGALQQRLAPPKSAEEGIVESAPARKAPVEPQKPAASEPTPPRRAAAPRRRFWGLFGSRG